MRILQTLFSCFKTLNEKENKSLGAQTTISLRSNLWIYFNNVRLTYCKLAMKTMF